MTFLLLASFQRWQIWQRSKSIAQRLICVILYKKVKTCYQVYLLLKVVMLKKKKNFMAPFYGWGSTASRKENNWTKTIIVDINYHFAGINWEKPVLLWHFFCWPKLPFYCVKLRTSEARKSELQGLLHMVYTMLV